MNRWSERDDGVTSTGAARESVARSAIGAANTATPDDYLVQVSSTPTPTTGDIRRLHLADHTRSRPWCTQSGLFEPTDTAGQAR
jgi:hypothetical protein